jgi:hypothetical protein
MKLNDCWKHVKKRKESTVDKFCLSILFLHKNSSIKAIEKCKTYLWKD